MVANTANNLHRLVIVGGGVAGLEVASSLARKYAKAKRQSLAITLIDRDFAHVWKPMLHTIAAGTSDVSQQQTLYLAQARDAGFVYQPGRLHELDREHKILKLDALNADDGREAVPARQVAYDTLVMAVGSKANDFGTEGVAQHCFMIDSRAQAEAFNREVRLRFLQSITQNKTLTIAIVGGGATGVELAAELVQLTEYARLYNAGPARERLEITLIEAGPRLLAGFPEDISQATQKRLESLGIKVMVNTQVQAANQDGFVLADDHRVPANLKVWAAGVKAPEFLAHLDGLEVTKSNQLKIKPSLQTTCDKHIYALGDCSSLMPQGAEHPLPPTAQVAHQQAQHLIKHLPAAIFRDEPVANFTYRDFGSLVSLADYDAFGSLGKFGFFKGGTIHGRLAHFSHIMLYRSHQARLHGFWRGSLLWFIDGLNERARPSIRMN